MHTLNVIDEDDGNTRGRKDKLRGQMGTSITALSDG